MISCLRCSVDKCCEELFDAAVSQGRVHEAAKLLVVVQYKSGPWEVALLNGNYAQSSLWEDDHASVTCHLDSVGARCVGVVAFLQKH